MNIYESKWLRRHLELAKMVATWSKDESTKVGCVIVSPKGLPVSWAYNGNPMGIKDTPERMERPLKYHYVAHAERNAIDICRRSVEGCVMIVTHVPCSSCAISIIQSGIAAVAVDRNNGTTAKSSYVNYNEKWAESVKHTLIMFEEANIEYREI